MQSKSEVKKNFVKLAVLNTTLRFFGVDAYPALQQPSGAQFEKYNETPAGEQPFVEPEVTGNASINDTDVEAPTTYSTVGSTVGNDTNTSNPTSAPSAASDSFDYTYLEIGLGVVGVGTCLVLSFAFCAGGACQPRDRYERDDFCCGC